MLTLIALPDNFVGDIASTSSAVLSSFGGYLVLIISILVVAVIIEIVIGALRHNR
jgi:hypothetical protein